MQAADPLILTAAFDPASGRLFQDLRDRYFPPRLNIVPAHLSLFHQLPGEAQADILDVLRAQGGSALPFTATGLRFLGRGVAVDILCPQLSETRKALAARWAAWLTLQDRQGFRAHVTVQNKVSPAEARATMEHLSESFVDLTGTVVGLDLWHYRGGPWESAGEVRWAPPA